MSSSTPFRILIVGGGAGGLELATRLGDACAGRPDVEITLVDRQYTHLWKPLLHEVAAGTLNSNDDELSYLAHAHWHHFQFRLGALEALDRGTKTVTLAPSLDGAGREFLPRRRFRYDLLVIAVGSVTNDFGIAGIAEHCLFLDGRPEADAFHQALVRACYAANAQLEPLREGQLHIAIAGAGATGVELAAELHHSLHTLLGFGLERLDPARDIRIHLIESSSRILPGLAPRIAESTLAVLESIGVIVHTDEFVTAATPAGFHTRSGKFIPAEIKVWAAGIKGPEVLGLLDLEVNRLQQLVVRSTLQTTRDDDIYAFGDCAACRQREDAEAMVPPRAQAAHQQASLLAKALLARIAGQAARPVYRYRDFGSLISLSKHGTVGNLMGNLFRRRSGSVSIEGWCARMAYLSLYKMHQIAVQGVIRTLLMTMANVLTRRAKPRLKLH